MKTCDKILQNMATRMHLKQTTRSAGLCFARKRASGMDLGGVQVVSAEDVGHRVPSWEERFVYVFLLLLFFVVSMFSMRISLLRMVCLLFFSLLFLGREILDTTTARR